MVSLSAKGSRGLRRRVGVSLRLVLFGAVAVALSTGGCGGASPPVAPSNVDYVVAPEFGIDLVLAPEHVQFGSTFAGWSAKWWEWVYELPYTNHPLFDPTGLSAAEGQVDPVWFLGPLLATPEAPVAGPAVRDIEMPAGTALFFPVFAVEVDNQSCSEPDTAFTFTELRNQASQALHRLFDVRCTIDGVTIIDSPDLEGADRFRAQAPEFEVEVPADNINAARCGEAAVEGRLGPIASDGIWMMIAPMPEGAHTVHFQAMDAGGTPVDVTYNITVR